jgi:hypothetical protein
MTNVKIRKEPNDSNNILEIKGWKVYIWTAGEMGALEHTGIK